MPVIKSKLQTRYFIYPNEVAQSKISLEAKGLIAYMSSKPDDWIFHKSEIMKECKVGRDKLNKIYKELEASGNLVVTQLHDQEGKFSRTETMFFVDPKNNPAFIPLTEKQQPFTDLPLTDLPYTAKQHLQSKDIIQSKEDTNICQQVADEWNNSMADELGQVKVLSNDRISKIKGCIKQFKKTDHDFAKIETWVKLFDYASQSDFLMGRKTDWSMNFDFIITKSKLLKIVEGQYENQ